MRIRSRLPGHGSDADCGTNRTTADIVELLLILEIELPQPETTITEEVNNGSWPTLVYFDVCHIPVPET
jgi:hypothetical protein